MRRGFQADERCVNESWRRARQHPRRTLLALFAGGFVGIALIQYLGPAGDSLYASLATGLACGLVLVGVGWGNMREGAETSRPLRPVSVFSALMIVSGLALLSWGIAGSQLSLALAGLPLLLLGASLVLARFLIAHRSRGN
jgi:hypothetical protein